MRKVVIRVFKSGIEPLTHGFSVHCSTIELLKQKLRSTGVEPVTDNLEGYCSSQLS